MRKARGLGAKANPGNASEFDSLVSSVEKSRGLLGPYEISDHLSARIEGLGLLDSLAHFEAHGYCVINDVYAHRDLDELTGVINTFATKDKGVIADGNAPYLLGRDPLVDKMVTHPKILAFAEVSVGNAFRVGQVAGSIKHKDGFVPDGVHSDQNWLPAPFPEHNCVITFCIPCEGMTDEEGATRIVPGSHLMRRHPNREERFSQTRPIEVEKGGVAVWDGSVWHCSGARKASGVRTMLHATYQRFYTQPIDDYSYLLENHDYMKKAPKEMGLLLGERAFFGTGSEDKMVDVQKFEEAMVRTRL